MVLVTSKHEYFACKHDLSTLKIETHLTNTGIMQRVDIVGYGIYELVLT